MGHKARAGYRPIFVCIWVAAVFPGPAGAQRVETGDAAEILTESARYAVYVMRDSRPERPVIQRVEVAPELIAAHPIDTVGLAEAVSARLNIPLAPEEPRYVCDVDRERPARRSLDYDLSLDVNLTRVESDTAEVQFTVEGEITSAIFVRTMRLARHSGDWYTIEVGDVTWGHLMPCVPPEPSFTMVELATLYADAIQSVLAAPVDPTPGMESREVCVSGNPFAETDRELIDATRDQLRGAGVRVGAVETCIQRGDEQQGFSMQAPDGTRTAAFSLQFATPREDGGILVRLGLMAGNRSRCETFPRPCMIDCRVYPDGDDWTSPACGMADYLAARRTRTEVRRMEWDPDPSALEVVSTEPRDGFRLLDVKYPSPRRGDVPGYLLMPEGAGPFPALLLVHGMPGDRRTMLPLAEAYARAGVAVLTITAPFARPDSSAPGRFVPGARFDSRDATEFSQLVRDLRRAVDVVAERADIDGDRIGVVGHSYGATASVLLAALEPDLGAIVLMAPSSGLATTAVDGIIGLPGVSYQQLTPREQAEWTASLAPFEATRWIEDAPADRVLIQAGLQDQRVSPANTGLLAGQAPTIEVRWYDAGHALSSEAYYEQAVFLSRWLRFDVTGFETPDAAFRDAR